MRRLPTKCCRVLLLMQSAFLLLPAANLATNPSNSAGLPSTLNNPSQSWPIGNEGKIRVKFSGPSLVAKPVDDKSPVIVRIFGERIHGNFRESEISFVGLEEGDFDLRNFILRADGSPAPDLPPLPVRFTGLLPSDHEGGLDTQWKNPANSLGGYRLLVIIAGCVWVLALAGMFLHRSVPKSASVPLEQPAPSVAKRLQPLLEAAAQGDLTAGSKAELERLLWAYWHDKLNISEHDPAQRLLALRNHPEAGVVLRKVEEWLHHPPGRHEINVRELLAPYHESIPVA